MGYGYAAPADMAFESRMRGEIIAAARAMNAGGTDFSTFENSRCNPRFWTRTGGGGFELNANVAPSAAINDIFVNGQLYAFECAMAMVMIMYKATINMIGEAAFNRYFTGLYLWDWNYDSNLKLITTFNRAELQPGDVVYFKNPDHDPAKPEWQGENAIMLSSDSYYGHGLGIKNATQMIVSLNRERVPGSRTSAYLADEGLHPDFAYIASLGNARMVPPVSAKVNAKTAIYSRIGTKSYIIR